MCGCCNPDMRYRAPLGLAELVLRGGSYELDQARSIRAEGLVLRMWQVFEDFLTRALTDALKPYGGHCAPQDTRHHLDRAQTMRLRPDLLYYRQGPDGRPVPAAVADAKYKTAKPGGTDSDVYQMLAYCTALDLAEGHLVYASGPDAGPRAHHINGSAGITVHQHILDLDRPPEDVLAQTAHIAARMCGDAVQRA